jgi:hypothetical protein
MRADRARAGARLTGLALAGVVLAGGCSGTDRTPGPSAGPPSAPPPATTPSSAGPMPGPAYGLTGSLCEKADLTALTELWSTVRKPLAETERLCATGLASNSMTVSLGVDAELLPDASTSRLFMQTGRRLSPTPAHDIGGAGADAFWTADGKGVVRLTAAHGNLVLELDIVSVTDGRRLPDDIAERLARVAAGTFERLAP